jgi:hypothetical protein
MRKIILMLFMGILVLGCSSNEDDGGNTLTPTHVDFKLNIDGVEINYPNNNPVNSFYRLYKNGENFIVEATYGQFGNGDATFSFVMKFSSAGKFIMGSLEFNSLNFGQPKYSNFIYFPSHYVQVSDFSFDEVNKKIKFKFDGNLYINNQSITSESRNVKGEIDMVYIDGDDDPYPIVINNVEQYCRANINSAPWAARFERSYSSFTDEDAYKVEINFANSPTPASYNFTSVSTSDYVKFSKFNPSTLVYDYYNVNGQVAYSYREFHGGGRYSFIGTFSFTAVNPNNPADVIQVTDGVFRSYQQF